MIRRLLFTVGFLLVVHDGTSIEQYREYTLTISFASNSSSLVVVNDLFPGPLIEADLNDVFIIHVKNNLSTNEELSVHFHGILQRHTSQMDGVAYITQMPIPRGQQFTYVFRAHPAGTHFYHSHSGLQAITAFGPLLVHDRRRPWNLFEVPSGPLLFSDLWQRSGRLAQETSLLGSPFQWIGNPTDLLINGQRDFVLTLKPNTKYLLRLIGAATLSTVVFGIDQHPMTVVEVDGTPIKPKSNLSSIEITSGQRYAVMIQTKRRRQGVFLMQVDIRWRVSPVNSR